MWPWGKDDNVEEAAATNPTAHPASTPDTQGPVTRRQTAQSATPPAFLQLPSGRPETHLERRRRNRTPSPRIQADTAFSYSSTMDEAMVQRLMEAAIRATQDSSRQQVQSLKKPDLPPFDKRNIEVWIKRVENAFTRIGCTDVKLKFAHLESKFEVGEDPIVDSNLFGESTPEQWTSLLTHFRTRYGKTKKDKALALINGVPREGRTPSQLAAAIDDKVGDVTIDDVKKEQLLRQLPPDVYRQIVDRVDKLTFKATAELADAWFDKQGNPLIGPNATSVNNIDSQTTAPRPETATTSSAATPPPSFTPPFPQTDDTDINAIRQRQAQKSSFNNRNNGRGRGSGSGNSSNSFRGNSNNNGNRSGNNNGRPGNSNNNNNNSSGNKPKNVCDYHIRYGKEALNCVEWCMLYTQHAASNARASK